MSVKRVVSCKVLLPAQQDVGEPATIICLIFAILQIKAQIYHTS